MPAAKPKDQDEELLPTADEAVQEEMELRQFHEYEWRQGPVKLTDIEPDSEIIAPAPTASFVRDMKRRGQLEPITLTLVKDKPWKYKIRFGRRRVLAARRLKWSIIKANVVLRTGEKEALLATIASNRQRAPNPMADVDALRQLEALHVPLELSGMSTAEIKQAVALSKLEMPFQTGVRQGLLSPGTAREILRLTPARRKPLLALVKDGQKVTAKAVHDVKRVQVGEGSQQLMAKLNLQQPAKTARPAWEMYLVLNPETKKVSGGLIGSLLTARNRAINQNDGSRVFRLVEV